MCDDTLHTGLQKITSRLFRTWLKYEPGAHVLVGDNVAVGPGDGSGLGHGWRAQICGREIIEEQNLFSTTANEADAIVPLTYLIDIVSSSHVPMIGIRR